MVYDIPHDQAKEVSKQDRADMKHFEVTPADKYLTGKQKQLKPKACYTEAFNYVGKHEDSKEIVLIHGLYTPATLNSGVGHAWVEIEGNIIFDGVLQRFYDKDQYYKHYQIVEHDRYNRKEMYSIGLKHGGHYGPWTDKQ